jgi:hypothetical protein
MGGKKGFYSAPREVGHLGEGQRVQCTMVQNWAAKIVGIQLGPICSVMQVAILGPILGIV